MQRWGKGLFPVGYKGSLMSCNFRHIQLVEIWVRMNLLICEAQVKTTSYCHDDFMIRAQFKAPPAWGLFMAKKVLFDRITYSFHKEIAAMRP